jgi:hypothetical protein
MHPKIHRLPCVVAVRQVDLYGWRSALDRLDRALAKALKTCPQLVLVGNKPEVRSLEGRKGCPLELERASDKGWCVDPGGRAWPVVQVPQVL